MIEKIFKISLVVILLLFLAVFYSYTQNNRYEVITEYEGSIGVLDTRKGVVYLLDLDTDQWTVIKPLAPTRPTI